jgi:D-inositol-3-phosphate glycosyltransferase
MFSIHSSPVGELGASDTGGMSVYISEIARELGRFDHRIDIFTRHIEPSKTSLVDLDENVRLIRLQSTKNNRISKSEIYPYLPTYFQALINFRKNNPVRYDIIHSHYWLSGILGNWVSRLLHVPHVIMFHTLGAVKNRSVLSVHEPWLRIATEKKLSEKCCRMIVATEREKRNIIKFYNASREKIAVVPCGVNLNLFKPLNKRATRALLRFDPDETIILYVGRFDPIKGLDSLLEAMRCLKHHKKLQLVIVGGDGYKSSASRSLRKLTKKLGIKDMVRFVGRVDQHILPQYYSAADVLVVPSHYESFSLVALEAMACGTPVIATPVGAIDNIIFEFNNGHIVLNNSPGSLAGGIELFLSEDRSSFFSATKIRETALKFDWSNVAASIMDQYTVLLNGHQNEIRIVCSSYVSIHTDTCW